MLRGIVTMKPVLAELALRHDPVLALLTDAEGDRGGGRRAHVLARVACPAGSEGAGLEGHTDTTGCVCSHNAKEDIRSAKICVNS